MLIGITEVVGEEEASELEHPFEILRVGGLMIIRVAEAFFPGIPCVLQIVYEVSVRAIAEEVNLNVRKGVLGCLLDLKDQLIQPVRATVF